MTTRDELADKLVLAALPHIPFEGWTHAALDQAAADLGLEEGAAGRLFPSGAVQAVTHFACYADRRLEEEAAASTELAGLRTGPRVGWLVRRRLEAWTDQREAVSRAVALLALPFNQPAALKSAWHTADAIWYLAGDTAADFSWYSRRALLTGILTAVTLVWLEDKSEGHAETWAFLDRRLADVHRLTRLRQDAEGRLKRLPKLLRTDPLRRKIKRRSVG